MSGASLPRLASLRVGETLEVRLPEPGPAGYLWDTACVARSSIASLARKTLEPCTLGDETVGGPNTLLLSLVGEREGTFVVPCRRPWDPEGDRADALRVSVGPREGGLAPCDLWVGRRLFHVDRADVAGSVSLVGAGHAVLRADDGRSHVLEGEGLRDWIALPGLLPPLPLGKRDITPGSLWRHRRGGLYVVLEGAARLKGGGTESVVYRGVASGTTWVRPRAEFLDHEVLGDDRFDRLV